MCICCWVIYNWQFVYLKSSSSSAMMTSSIEYLDIQSRTACNTITNRRSSAFKCGSHKIGAIGSIDIDSFMRFDKGVSLLWILKLQVEELNILVIRRIRKIFVKITLEVFEVLMILSCSIAAWAQEFSNHHEMLCRKLVHDHSSTQMYHSKMLFMKKKENKNDFNIISRFVNFLLHLLELLIIISVHVSSQKIKNWQIYQLRQ